MTDTSDERDVRPIPSLPGYFATSGGEILNRHGWALTARPKPPQMYLYVQPRVAGRQKQRAVHRLVAEAFHGALPTGLQTRHLNGVKSDCSASNLAYGTARQNYEDSVRHGTARGPAMIGCFGQRHPASKLTEEQAIAILAAVDSGESQHVVAKRFGVSQMLVSRIHRGLNWPHLRGPRLTLPTPEPTLARAA